MRKTWKTLKALALIISLFPLFLMILRNTVIGLISQESAESLAKSWDSIINKTALLWVFVIAVVLYLLFFFLQRHADGEFSVLKIVGGVIIRAAIFALAYWGGEKLLSYVVEMAMDNSAAEMEDELWGVFGPLVLIGGILIVGWIIHAAAGKRESQAVYSSSAPSVSGSAQSASESTGRLAPNGNVIVKRFSQNAWEEKSGTRYLMVNCFYDNYGKLHTIDESSFDRELERFSDENRVRHHGNASVKTYRDGVIYGTDGGSGYRGFNDWIRDGRGNTFVVRNR